MGVSPVQLAQSTFPISRYHRLRGSCTEAPDDGQHQPLTLAQAHMCLDHCHLLPVPLLLELYLARLSSGLLTKSNLSKVGFGISALMLSITFLKSVQQSTL